MGRNRKRIHRRGSVHRRGSKVLKQEKRELAEEMLKHWRSLTPQQQLKELNKRPGKCEKQKARIMKKIKEEEKEKQKER